MDLWTRTETEKYVDPAVFAREGNFILVRYGWFHYAFFLDPEELKQGPEVFAAAAQMVDAIRALDE